jgi:serine/threonine-protein kinase
LTIHHAGDVIGGRYAITRFIDEGGMQEVYEATDRLLSRTVALKTPKTSSASKRFKRSAEASARVNHANVAKTLDYLEENSRFYLIEELILGCDLRAFFRDYVPHLDPYMCAHVLHHLAKGLAASHHADVIHRDLKPSNIMVVGAEAFEGVKITDFGIAKMAKAELEAAMKDDVTQSATALGALPYMAPEMIDSFSAAARPADVWSLGAMAFEMLTGNRPFGGNYAAVPLIQAAQVPPLPASLTEKLQFAALAKEIYAVITKCLVRDLAQRPTADDLVRLCSDLCYSVMPREFGTIGYMPFPSNGFINRPGQVDVFFHQDSVPEGQVGPGQKVWFSRHPGEPRERALPVVPARESNSGAP